MVKLHAACSESPQLRNREFLPDIPSLTRRLGTALTVDSLFEPARIEIAFPPGRFRRSRPQSRRPCGDVEVAGFEGERGFGARLDIPADDAVVGATHPTSHSASAVAGHHVRQSAVGTCVWVPEHGETRPVEISRDRWFVAGWPSVNVNEKSRG